MEPRPHVSLNFAISADGKISTRDGMPSGWTSAADFERFLRVRLDADALMVGRGTLEADRMGMVIPSRLKPEKQPLRCVVTRHGNIDPDHKLFRLRGGPIHLLVTDPPRSFDPSVWQEKGATVHRDSLGDFLASLRRNHGVKRLHCEGGGMLVRALADLGAIDEIHLTWAGHALLGGHDAPSLSGLPGTHLPTSLAFELIHFEPLPEENECFLTYRRVGGPHSADGAVSP